MAVKASATITLFDIVDIDSVTIYYLLQSSTANPPAKPTTDNPGGSWSTTEPTYTEGSTNTLYTVTKTKYSDGTFEYTPVSKSSSYEAAKAAYNKAVNAQNTANNAQEGVDAIPSYIASRGENLVTNGTALLGNNRNFSHFTYDGSDTYGAGGCFKYIGRNAAGTNYSTDEFIPVDISDSYILTYYIKTDHSECKFYDMLLMYDIDKNPILDHTVLYVTNTLTTLSQELKNGDTVIHLTDVSNFRNQNGNYSRKLIFWDYKNSFGYQYEPETYSRNVYGTYNDPLWENETDSIDYENNTITLRKPWAWGTKPVGTKLSQGNNGATNEYLNSYYSLTPDTWTKKVGYMSSNRFRKGTAFVKINWYLNWNSTDNRTTKISTVSLTKNPSISNTIKSVDVEYYLSTSSSTITGGSWSTTAPTWVDGKYMWSRQKITYANNSVETKNQTCIAGAKGSTGVTGTGVTSITEEYYLSTSKTTQTGGSWTTTPPTWSNGKYIWTRSKIIYNNPTSTSYTTPVCSSEWEAVNEIKVGGTNLIKNGSGKYKKGFFNNFVYNDNNELEVIWDLVADASTTHYASTSLTNGFVIPINKYEPGEVYTWSYDIMYLEYTGVTQIGEKAIGQRYTTGGQQNWQRVTEHDLPIGSSYELNIWYHIVRQVIIPTTNYPQTGAGIQETLRIGYKSESGGRIRFRLKNVKLEHGNIETDWSPAPEDTEETIQSLNTYVDQVKDNLQNQIDGAIQFWNGENIPTLNNYPASSWTTETERINHIADIYTVIQDVNGELKQGKGYRFDKVNNNWVWVEITDNELSAVQALATSKAKVFVVQPTAPYNIGDLWLKDNKLYKCKTAKDASGSYSLSDWELATDYTNDDLANQVQTNLNNLQVGGRNLLLGTSESFNNNDMTYSYGYWDIAKSTFKHGIDLEPNEEYILSFDWKIDWNTDEEITKERYYVSVGVGELITTMDQDVIIDQYVTYNSDIKMFNTTSNMSLNYEDIDKTGGSEELHFIPTAAQLANYNKFAMRLARTSVQSSSNTPTITIENLKLEKGTKKTDWSPAPEDIDADIDTSNSNIKDLDELLNGINEQGGLISQITDIQQTMAEEFQAVKDRYDAAMAVLENSIVSTIKSIGGSNILHNSVGYNNLEFWNTSTQNKISTYQNDELSLSGSEFILKGGALMWQEVNIQSGMKYNLSCKIKHDTFNTPDTISIKIIQNDPDNTTLELLGVTTQYLDWMSIEVQTRDENNNLISGFIPKPLTTKLKIELSCGGNDNTELFEITDLFLTIGESTIWSGHPDEIYGKEHLLDATGLTLKNLNTNKYARLTSTSLSLLSEYTTIAEISEQRLLSQNGIFLKGYQLGDETKGQPPLKTVRIDENNIIEYVVSLPPTPAVINYTDISIIEIESEDAGENSVDESFSTESGTEIDVVSLSYANMATFITDINDGIENGSEINLGDLINNIQGLSENLSGQYVTYSLDGDDYISDTDDINDNSVLSSFKVISKPLAFGYADEDNYILSDLNNNYLIDYMSIQNDLLIGLGYGDISNLYIMILDPKGSPNYYQIFSIDNLNEIGEFYPYQGIAGLFSISMQGIIVILEDISNT